MQRQCPECGRRFTAQRSTAVYCKPRCRSRHHNRESRMVRAVDTRLVDDHPLVVAVRRELEAAGRLETPDGYQAVQAAELICSPSVSNAELVAASKELSRTVAEALGKRPTRSPARPPDELTVRRGERQKKGYR